MEGFDRRKFLKGSTVAAGLAGAMTVIPGALPALAKSTSNTRGGSRALAIGGQEQDHGVEPSTGTAEPVVAHVRDAKKGEIDVFIGTRHFTLQDRGLANKIMGAAR
jgi:hypothetical protein